jgi:glycosyltransferase involved in cell wall biosynthesis
MILGVLPEQGGSIENLRAAGQDGRFVDEYLRRYAGAFARVYYFSYADERPVVPQGCDVVPNGSRLHRWLYAAALPLLQARRFRQCSVLRVMQLTGEVPALVAKLLYGVPFAATYGYRYSEHARADEESRIRAALFALRTRVALRLADKVIVTNPEIRDEVAGRLNKSRIVFLPNGVDVSRFSPAAAQTDGAVPTLLFVGRLAPVKNLELLLEAAAQLRRPVKVRFVGTGPLADDLAARARRLGVTLELPGVVEHSALPGELRRAAVFVLTSRIEGHPKALLEAMSCGCVCVATSSPGIVDLLEHERTGLLTAPDPESVARAIARALDDGALRERLARNARARVERDYDIAAILEREVAMLLELGRSGR